jgi:hypothetical protein
MYFGGLLTIEGCYRNRGREPGVWKEFIGVMILMGKRDSCINASTGEKFYADVKL